MAAASAVAATAAREDKMLTLGFLAEGGEAAGAMRVEAAGGQGGVAAAAAASSLSSESMMRLRRTGMLGAVFDEDDKTTSSSTALPVDLRVALSEGRDESDCLDILGAAGETAGAAGEDAAFDGLTAATACGGGSVCLGAGGVSAAETAGGIGALVGLVEAVARDRPAAFAAAANGAGIGFAAATVDN